MQRTAWMSIVIGPLEIAQCKVRARCGKWAPNGYSFQLPYLEGANGVDSENEVSPNNGLQR